MLLKTIAASCSQSSKPPSSEWAHAHRHRKPLHCLGTASFFCLYIFSCPRECSFLYSFLYRKFLIGHNLWSDVTMRFAVKILHSMPHLVNCNQSKHMGGGNTGKRKVYSKGVESRIPLLFCVSRWTVSVTGNMSLIR